MKKAYLTLSLAVILLGGFLMNPSWGEAQNQCTVSSATFTQPEDNSFDKKKSTLNIKTNGCEYTNLSVVLKYFASDDYIWTHQIKNLPGILKVASDGDLTLEITLGEDPCWSANKDPYGFPCVTFIEVYQGGNLKFSGNETYGSEFITKEKVKLGKNDPNVLKDYRNKGVLIGECSSTLFCKEGSSNVWELSKLLKGTSQQTQSCIINPNDIQYGELPFEKDSNGNSFPTITNANLTLNINTTNCKGLPITLSIYGTEGKVDIKVPEKGAVTEITKTAVGDELKFSFKTHDEECSIQKNPHCQFGTTITQNGTPIVSTQNLLETIVPGVAIDWNYYRNNGVIFAYCSSGLGGVYYCERLGANDWTLLKVSGSAGEDTPEVFETITPKFDPESPCFVQELNGGNGGYDEDCYELLAPVPGLKGATDPLGNNRWSINLKNFQIGDYVNSLFSIALGILTLLAVIMIVIAGVQYMTIESFQGKSDAKSRITGALTGLLLALSIYIILGTINPDLLQVNFGSNIEEVKLEGMQLSPEQLAAYGNDYNTAMQQGTEIPPDNQMFQDEGFIAYLYHQQGEGGAPSIIYSAQQGWSKIEKTPWASNKLKAADVNKNMNNNWPSGVNRGNGSPSDFLRVWWVVWNQRKTEISLIPKNVANIVTQVANEEKIEVNRFKTVCMIESSCNNPSIKNDQGYKGLFQFSDDTFASQKKPGCDSIFDAYCNSYAGARYMKYNLSRWNKHKAKIF
ncbi:MAG: transglycosylase SLT domain-containing protein [Candidatus Pacebacteria bacterium]|nr:transglycosylase SLT domain-containing protein [Candidatus Paceibacterota bacterium]